MKNITYYIGAGYSANAVPIVRHIPKRIGFIIYILKDAYKLGEANSAIKHEHVELTTQKEFLEGLEWMKTEAGKHASIDTFAKKLYLTRNNKLTDLKILLSCYLLLEQFPWLEETFYTGIISEISGMDEEEKTLTVFFDQLTQLETTIDSRYDTFFASIMNRGKNIPALDGNIKVISWNYDSQFELAAKPFFSDDIHYENIIEELQARLSIYQSNVDLNRFALIRLNGIAAFYDAHQQSRGSQIISIYDTLKNHVSQPRKILTEILQHYHRCKYNHFNTPVTIKPTITYAWEDSSYSEKAISNAKEVMKKTEILIIGGYSFPYFNRKVDRELFQSMESLEKIYINDKKPEAVKTKLNSVMPFLLKRRPSATGQLRIHSFTEDKIVVLDKDEVEQFFLPDEL